MIRYFQLKLTNDMLICVTKNTFKYPHENLLIKTKRQMYKQCVQCFHNFHSFGIDILGLYKSSLFRKPQEVIFSKSFQLRTLSVHEQKLEKYLRNLNWDLLVNKSPANIANGQSVFNLLKEKEKLEEIIKELELMKEKEANTKDSKEMLQLIDEDLMQQKVQLTEIYEKIIDFMVPKGDFEDCHEILLEITAGVGGMEAMLFAGELRNMYIGFLEYKGWEFYLTENNESELGGVRHCSLLVTGPGAYSILQHEAGVHRVQRVPETERSGRMHTSTVTVAVLPQPDDIEINLKESDLRIETKRASGAGGQHVNTTESAVRITHLPTGISVECQTDRSQIRNRATALKQLKIKLYERELSQVDSNIRTQRKLQVGTSARSEKIRTYNFRDDRVSDHRLSVNLHNIKNFLEGGEELEKLLEHLIQRHHESQIIRYIDSLPD